MTTITHGDKLNKLKEFNKESEVREFLIDLLKKVGFDQVLHTHRYGSPEEGKDIIAKHHHPVEGDEWYAFVVKFGRIGGNTNEIETIKNQIKQAFEYPYQGINGEKRKINKVKVVTNENFTKGAQQSINNSTDLSRYNNYGFWWNEILIEKIDEHYEDFWLPGDVFAKEYSKSFMSKLKAEIEIKELSIQKFDDSQLNKLLNIFIEPKLTSQELEADRNTKEKKIVNKSISVNSIHQINENIILSGEQGAGKTKILNTIATQIGSVEEIYNNKTIPVKLKASYLRNCNYNIEDCVKEELKKHAGEFYYEESLDDYKPILFVDDLDILPPSDKNKIFDQIKRYCSANDTYYVLTYLKTEFDFDKDVKTIRIHNFNINQIESFIEKFFEGSKRGKNFIRILKESDILSKLPTTPLTITLISLLYDENHYEIPATLSDIYQDFTSVLLGKLEIEDKFQLLKFNIKKRLFTAIALEMLDNKCFEVSLDYFKSFINDFLDSRGYAIQGDEEILDLIKKSGLLYLTDNNIVGFKQNAFAEFFASLEIYHHAGNKYYNKMTYKFNDTNWQNTTIFYAGHSKELEGIIDNVISNTPNETLKDLFINSGGYGYLSQALYQTKPNERKKLVNKALENLIQSFYKLKEESKNSENPFYNIPLPLLASIITYWFLENFKSVTLIKTLDETFNEIYELPESFENNYKLLMLASTFINPYINDDSYLGKLMERQSFINSPILPLVAETTINISMINEKEISDDKHRDLKKAIRKKRSYIQTVLKEPAYRFNDQFQFDKEK